jgi:hypothetical protein
MSSGCGGKASLVQATKAIRRRAAARSRRIEIGAAWPVARRQQFPVSFKNLYYLPLRVHNVIRNISGVGYLAV